MFAAVNSRILIKTNASRLLDRLQIPYELREYEVDPDDLSAETVAAKIDLPPEQVFKTLVVKATGRMCIWRWFREMQSWI